AAYPLTALSYAVASPSTLDAAAGKDYAALVRYAVGPGQQPGTAPGQLPLGMAPLPDSLRTKATDAAATIEAQAGKQPPGSPDGPSPGPSGEPGLVPGAGAGDTGGSTGSSSSATGQDGTATSSSGGANTVATPSGQAAKAPGVVQQPVVNARRTPALPAPAVGALLLTILICGGLAAGFSPVVRSPVLGEFRAAVLRRVRRGVRPTEQ
ncbi:MAG TPA: hypothetical protein VFO16_10105, partial [Pseudonocardiaceae bacterium]|nr:hypothetical protein [Pseudonocardiaceae bacterium]